MIARPSSAAPPPGMGILAVAGLLGAAVLAAPLRPTAAPADRLAGLTGTFVGRAEETDPAGGGKEERDIDIIVARHGKDGLKIAWTNVALVDGRRDVPGVKRRSDEIILTPVPGRDFFLANPGYDPFHERKAPDPIAGDPLRWAVLRGDRLDVHSFAILEDGRYELQTYTRRTTPDGMALGFERIVDGEPVRRMTGKAVRAE